MVEIKNEKKQNFKKQKYTKVYLKNCRGKKEGCIHKFFTTQSNKLYCSAWCRHESVREKGRKRVEAFRKKYKNEGTGRKVPNWLGTNSNFKEEYESLDPTYLGTYIKFFNEWQSVTDMKNETFVTCTSEGEHSHIPSLSYQGVTHDDLHAFSISYLKDNQVKCPECSNTQNWIEHALNICSQCGLVLKAPPIHPGFVVDDLLPKRKVAATVQDFPVIDFTKKKEKRQPKPSGAVKEAHDKAYQKYENETSVFFEEEDTNDYSKNDPMNPLYWTLYEDNKIYNK